MWELDYKESWALKNWCFWTVVLEKTLESPLDCKEIQPVHPKGNQSWIVIGRTDAEAEPPILWPPDVKSWLIWKVPDAGKDWGQEEKGTTEDEMVGWHQQLNGRETGWALEVVHGQGGRSAWVRRVGHDWATGLNWTDCFLDKLLNLSALFCHLWNRNLQQQGPGVGFYKPAEFRQFWTVLYRTVLYILTEVLSIFHLRMHNASPSSLGSRGSYNTGLTECS